METTNQTNQILPGGWLETARDCAACFSFQLRFSPDTGLVRESIHVNTGLVPFGDQTWHWKSLRF